MHAGAPGDAGAPVQVTATERRGWLRWVLVAGGGVLLAGLLGGLAARRVRQDAPVVALLDRMGEGTGEERRRARQALVEHGVEAVPVLVRVVRGAKTRWQSEVMPWFEVIPPVSRMRGRHLARERNAIEALQRIGPAAAPALLDLLDEGRNGGRETAIAVLRAYGPSTVPLLHTNLRSARVERRIGAALALGRFRAKEQGGLGVLLEAGSDSDARVRSAVIWALGEMQDSGQDVIPELIRALNDGSEGVCLQAVQALRGFEAEAAPAVPGLREQLRRRSARVQAETALTLSTLGSAARVAGDDLRLLLGAGDADVRRHGAAALVELEVHAEDGLGVLRSLLGQPAVAGRARAAESVAGLGSKAAVLVPELLQLLENAETGDDRPAVVALRQIAPEKVPERFRRGRPPR